MNTHPVEVMVDGIRTAILRWNINWLEQQKAKSHPPEICRQPPKKLKLVYETYKDYETTMVPLLMQETWAQIYEEWSRIDFTSVPMDVEETKPFGNSNKQSSYIMKGIRTSASKPTTSRHANKDATCVPAKQFYVGVTDYKSDNEASCLLKCQYIVDADKLQDHLKVVSDGDLVQLDLVIDGDLNLPAEHYSIDQETGNKIVSVFAYVENVSSEKMGARTILAGCFTHKYRNTYVISYDVMIAKRRIRLNTKAPMCLRYLYYLKPTLRQFESIFYLQESPLASDILCPKLATCQLSLPRAQTYNPTSEFNELQQKIIVGSNAALAQNYPKIQLIQGPPGTGKTHTLIGMVKHLYTTWKEYDAPKILICAPSNGAIDEVTKRLLAERTFMKKTHFNRSLRMVRVGNPDHINPLVKKISLDELVEANEREKLSEVRRKVEGKIKELEKELASYDTEIATLRAISRHDKIPAIELRMAKVFKELETFKTSAETVKKREASEASKMSLRIELVKNADVILATLNSCQRHPIDILFKGDRHEHSFHCVIVDEASQCCEPELLMPLRYKISKLILIGDPMQLPATVISRFAQDFDFGRSLFERFFIYFGKYNPLSPVVMLTHQYRMHPDICCFPSRKFYDDRLVSVTDTSNKLPINPYTVFDLRYSRENRSCGKSIMNEAEADLVRSILHVILLSLNENSTIGVITPYKSQKRLLTTKLQNLKNEKNISIEINTCDGFQGQEKDVIILSCVRSETEGGIGFLKSLQRVNVALTRAKHCNIVCISAKSLERDDNWLEFINDAKRRNFFHVLSQDPAFNSLKRILGRDLDCSTKSMEVDCELKGKIALQQTYSIRKFAKPTNIAAQPMDSQSTWKPFVTNI